MTRDYEVRRAVAPEVPVDVRQGARRDAIIFSVGANTSQNLRRTNDDKRRAVIVLLNDPEWSSWSNCEIARQCAVEGLSHKLLFGCSRRTLDIAGNDAHTFYQLQTSLLPSPDHRSCSVADGYQLSRLTGPQSENGPRHM